MKLWAGLPLLLGVGALMHPVHPVDRQVLLLTGDSRGSLSPCGCTKPMTGGIRRLATAIKAYGTGANPVLLVNGDLTGGYSRQEEMKAQTLAETLAKLSPIAVRLGKADEQNPQAAAALRSFLGDRLLEPDRTIDSGGFRVIGDGDGIVTAVRQAASEGLKPAVLMEGGQEEAKALARQLPEISLIEYRLDGRAEWSREGATLMITPGSKLRDLVVLNQEDGKLSDPKVVPLDEHLADDPSASAIYRAYLGRVDKADLISQVERSGSEKFAGSARCVSCHTDSGKVWAHSRHSQALKSLEGEGHGKDPECVGCHVVGLDRTYGFRDRLKTANLANVGCESCHGAGLAHALRPKTPLPKVGEKRCLSCHTSEQSPGFNFQEFWRQIKH